MRITWRGGARQSLSLTQGTWRYSDDNGIMILSSAILDHLHKTERQEWVEWNVLDNQAPALILVGHNSIHQRPKKKDFLSIRY